MLVINSEIFRKVEKTYHLPVGDLYFFENIAVMQINEGEHASLKSSQYFLKKIYDFYETKNKPYGYISNRVNKYSVEVLDYQKHTDLLPNLSIYGIVAYSQFDSMNIDIEKQFCKMPVSSFNDLDKAYKYVNNYIVNKSNIIDSLIKK